MQLQCNLSRDENKIINVWIIDTNYICKMQRILLNHEQRDSHISGHMSKGHNGSEEIEIT